MLYNIIMNKISLTIKDSALSFILSFFLCHLGSTIAICLTLIVYKLGNFNMEFFESFFNTAVGYLISTLALYVTMAIIFVFFNKNKDNPITKKVEFKRILMYIAIACLSFVMLYPLIVCIDSLLTKCGFKLNSLTYELTTPNYFISLISLVLAPAICEELLFRGLILSGLKKHGKIFSILISALMFCIFHMSIGQTIYPLLMGILLGVIMTYEQNIYYCIAVHMTNNFLSLTLSYLKINLVFNHWSYVILAVLLAIVFISLLIYFLTRNKCTTEKIKPTKTETLILCASLALMAIVWSIINFA